MGVGEEISRQMLPELVTLIAAPGLLTGATSVLALSTMQLKSRKRDFMSQLLAKSETHRPEQFV